MNANSERIIELFSQALARPSPEERARFLAETCRDEPEVRAQVESLLRAEEPARDFLKQPPPGTGPVLDTEKPGDCIGRYKLLEAIGEGGCGVVYMAEQEEPVRRRVALKVIKLGMDTKQVVARFEAERQALALMDHPNIAKIFDGGATGHPLPSDGRGAGGEGSAQSEISNLKSEIPRGRPYFVMELVRGLRITDYCDQNHLSTAERLKLFAQVCQAIQHAHQKGIIHRDLKPSNILVTVNDGVAVPKVIDFGIAKAIDQRLTDKSYFTAFQSFIGTPAYTSPEQAEMSSLDIDTRSDIYSLGVLLYELLTGQTPFDADQLQRSGLDEMRRIIREEEPAKPSTRLTQELATSGARASGKVGDEPRRPADSHSPTFPPAHLPRSRREAPELHRLIALMRGDLDWIVMKCLEKDRARRYETANGLAADIQRHLNHETVLARPASAAYRFSKLVRRNKLAFAAATAVAVVLVLGAVVSTWQAMRATQAQRATANALRAETRAKGELEQNLERERVDSYFHRITLAQRELSVDNLGGALKFLGECPADLRGWEWYYLMRLGRVGPVVLQDTNSVNSITFRPDGQQIAAGCGDGTVKVWDLRTGKVVQTLYGHQGHVFSVTFRPPDGRYLASASVDQTIHVWDLTTEKAAFKFPGFQAEHTGMASAVAFSPEGRHLIAGSEDGTAVIWSAVDGSEVRRLPGKHETIMSSAAYSPDGRFLATGSRSGVLRIWDARTYDLLHTNHEHSLRISAVAFGPDGRWLATASFDRTLKIWDPTTGKLERTLRGHQGIISGLSFSSDGRRLASCEGELKTVKLWDPLTGREILNFRGHTVGWNSVAFSPAGRQLASAGGDGTIRIWDATPLKPDEALESLTREHDDEVWSVAFSPDGRLLASASWDKTVRLWDARTSTLIHTLPHPDRVFRVAFSPDGQRLAAAALTSERNSIVIIWDTRTGQDVLTLRDEKSRPYFVAFDPEGRYLLKEGPNFTVQAWNARTGEEAGILSRHALSIWCLKFSPDGRHFATACSDGWIRVWAWDPARLAQPREPDFTLPACVIGYGERVGFSPDGQWVVTGGEDHTVMIWSAKTGQQQQTLRGHTGDVFAVAFSPDGRWLASAGEDTTVRIWDARSWKPRHTLRGHTGLVSSLAFSPDGRRLGSGSWDHTMKVWDTERWDEAHDR